MGRRKSTTRHYDVLEAIRVYKNDHGFSPSMRNLMDITGIKSLSLISYYLDRLEEEGLIRREKNVSRSIEVMESSVIGNSSKKFSLKLHQIDQCKHSNEQLNKKRAAAARKYKPVGAFVPRKTKKTDKLQARIEMVVALAREQGHLGTGRDVVAGMPHRLRVWCVGQKLG